MVLYVFISYEVLTFESVKEILRCYHLNETSFAELLHSTIYFLGFYKKKIIFGNFFPLANFRSERVYQHFLKEASLDTCIRLVL